MKPVVIGGVGLSEHVVDVTQLSVPRFRGDARAMLRARYVAHPDQLRGPRKWVLDGPLGSAEVHLEGGEYTTLDHGKWVNRAVLRVLLAHAIEASGDVLLHAASLLVGGRAWLFLAPSGTGKSTLAMNAQHPVLADDTVLLQADASGVWVTGTPLTSTPGQIGSPDRVRVAAICFLGRSVEVVARGIRASQAAIRLPAATFAPPRAGRVPAAIVATLLRLAGDVPAYDLRVPLGYRFSPGDVLDSSRDRAP